jgi:hypothetical protein
MRVRAGRHLAGAVEARAASARLPGYRNGIKAYRPRDVRFLRHGISSRVSRTAAYSVFLGADRGPRQPARSPAVHFNPSGSA